MVLYSGACARSGAMPLKSRAIVSPRRARCASTVPAPAIVDLTGSTPLIANAGPTAASTALPPRSRTRAPTSAPRGCSATTMPRRVSGIRFVTLRLDWIMAGLSLVRRVLQVLRDVHELALVEVEDPPVRIAPRFVGPAADVRPVAAGPVRHLLRVVGGREGRAEQDLDLSLVHADRHLVQETEGLHGERIGRRRFVLAQVLRHPGLEVVLEVPFLLERRRTAVGGDDLRRPELVGGRALRGALVDRVRGHRAAGQEDDGEQDERSASHAASIADGLSRTATASPGRS